MSRPSPRVSIGLPAYKAGRWIRTCLDSLLAQTLVDFEIIVSDNASPDDTVAVCEAYARRDSRIRILRQAQNIGVSGNQYATLDAATAPYFCWASANDWYAPDFLARLVAVLASEPDLVLAATRASTFRDSPGDGIALAEPALPDCSDLRRQPFVVMASMKHSRLFRGLYRRDVLLEIPRPPPVFGADHRLIVDLSTRGRIRQLHEPLYFERLAPGATTAALPMHERARHYEPATGWRGVVFHRIRALACHARLGCRHAMRRGGLARLPARLAMVAWHQRSMVYNDLVEFGRIVASFVSRRPAARQEAT